MKFVLLPSLAMCWATLSGGALADNDTAHLAQGAAKFVALCAACHGTDGHSVVAINPKLSQQHPEYIIQQLSDFKSGRRTNPIMQGMAATLTDTDVKNVANWLGTQRAKPMTTAPHRNAMPLGERVYRRGIPDRQVPACAGCHSPSGAGMPAQYPRLAGQHAEYLSIQLVAFRHGTRTNHTTMNQVAAKLDNHDIQAVADYVAGLH